MSKPISIASSSQFKTTLSSNTYVIADFYADWCGPCKVIAPVFEQLASAEAKPGRLAFVKVNVDNQRDIAGTYRVSAMPTFLVFKNGSVTNTIQGADPSALRSAVSKAAADAAKGPPRQAQAFSSKGHVLGSSSSTGSQRTSAGSMVGGAWLNGSLADTFIRFIMLYFTSLFSFDAYAAAEASPYNIRNQRAARR